MKSKLVRWAVQLFRQISGLKIPVYASHASFFIVLSLFPSLVLLLGLLRYTGLEVENLTRMLDGVIPAALMPAARRLMGKNGSRISKA